MKPQKYNLLYLTVFITGTCVLVIEVIAVRILSQYFGNTIYTFSSVLSVILAALSIGYYVGGLLADKYPNIKIYSLIIALSGLMVMSLNTQEVFLVPNFLSQLPITTGPLISSLILFFLPATLLGTLSPYTIKLITQITEKKDRIGEISGKVFFFSTTGSITGSLSAGFILIPSFGLKSIMFYTGVTLFSLGIFLLIFLVESKKKIELILLLELFITFVFLSNYFRLDYKNIIYSADGVYEKLIITEEVDKETGKKFRGFYQDISSSGAEYLDDQKLYFDYSKYYELHKFSKQKLDNALVLGGGIYSIPTAIARENPQAIIDVVEIEPSLYQLAIDYFSLSTDDKNVVNHVTDARKYLRESSKNYDLIFTDVYKSYFSMPSHLATQEFFKLSKERLSEDGVFIGNFIGSLRRDEKSFLFSAIKTFRSVYPNSFYFAVRNPYTTAAQNFIFLGFNNPNTSIEELENIKTNAIYPETFNALNKNMIDLDRFDIKNQLLLTDDFSPVESLNSVLVENNHLEELTSGENALRIVSQLTSYGPRFNGSSAHLSTQKFIEAEMKTYTDEFYKDTFQIKEYEYTNLIARYNANLGDRILIGTHYGSLLPVIGANDSASGVASMIEIARLLALNKANIGVDFIFFDGEEGPPDLINLDESWFPIGSTRFAENISEFYSSPPQYAIILDMICDKNLNFSVEKNSQMSSPKLYDRFWLNFEVKNPGIYDGRKVMSIVDDHVPLTRIGIPSLLVIDFDYPYHHTTQDTYDKCSSDSLDIVTNYVYEFISSDFK